MKAADIRSWRSSLWLVIAILLLAPGTKLAADDFSASMGSAMARMDRDMMVLATGDPDRDFAAMMIPHHQGAIDMAEVELRFGHDPVLRRLAQGIIVEQQQEITVMRQALEAAGRPSPNPASPTPNGASK
jgi:uncharacterized protein (DUF305 family)